MSVRLYIGNLPKEVIDKSELQAIFAEEGNAVTTKLIKDRKTGKCRGFGFITVNNDEKADQIIEKYNGQMFKETAIKVEKALPRSKGEENNEEQAAKASSGAGSPQKEGKKGKKSRRNSPKETSSSSHDSDAVRPDPRWAAELEKLKEMLAAQATN
ncbi:RNA recognition motif domain-containing protein [Mastigocoleus testarum]|uniref:RNA-binding protein n=1 Tax=Mastigocoleus testarum BC008 TaxID=371196 RepID=A0A0V7ZVE0_9CYAN|nr:RNA-binding protein [Mastigocoleus testarum]KST67964.1 RNA-binding protein [Mastigocoleus testarum BC008]KST68411.1 RNA-binding protein [Mastigocoleus testarum BC008]